MDSTVQTPIVSLGESIGRAVRYWRFFRRNPVLPIMIVILIIISAVFAPWLAPHDPLVGNLRDQDRPPAWQATSPISGKEGLSKFLLGTDPLGRDILSRIIWGARFSMIIAGIVIVTGAVGGTILGMVAGYFGGIWDEALMRMVDLTLGVPFILVALAGAGLWMWGQQSDLEVIDSGQVVEPLEVAPKLPPRDLRGDPSPDARRLVTVLNRRTLRRSGRLWPRCSDSPSGAMYLDIVVEADGQVRRARPVDTSAPVTHWCLTEKLKGRRIRWSASW